MTTTTNAPAAFANQYGYSDVTPFEVVRIISDKTVEVRAMSAELSPEWTPEIAIGGFVGHCTNNNRQEWTIVPDQTAHVFRIRLTKQGWKDAHGNRYRMSDAPQRFYDYNF